MIFDNYDSFTYNLVHLVEKIKEVKLEVVLNDQIAIERIKEFDKIILSPGPGVPSEVALMKEMIQTYGATKSILGVCLGHQAIGEAFGARLKNLEQVFHGVATPIKITDPRNKLFKGMDTNQLVGRYHSWVVSSEFFPKELIVTAVDEDNNIMALKHHFYDIQGVQFHPESILTPCGEKMMRNWLND